jgi:hypothetical protein
VKAAGVNPLRHRMEIISSVVAFLKIESSRSTNECEEVAVEERQHGHG